jgi:hypothetical protein
MNLRELIETSDDLRHEDVTVPEWAGVTLRLSEMNGTLLEEYQAATIAAREGPDGKAQTPVASFVRLLRYSVHDPASGDLVFDDESIAVLYRKSAHVITRLGERALSLNRTEEAAPAAPAA